MRTRALIERAIVLFGTEAKLAKACGCPQQTINRAKQVDHASLLLAMQLERATKGLVKAKQIRPDAPWPTSRAGLS